MYITILKGIMLSNNDSNILDPSKGIIGKRLNIIISLLYLLNISKDIVFIKLYLNNIFAIINNIIWNITPEIEIKNLIIVFSLNLMLLSIILPNGKIISLDTLILNIFIVIKWPKSWIKIIDAIMKK